MKILPPPHFFFSIDLDKINLYNNKKRKKCKGESKTFNKYAIDIA